MEPVTLYWKRTKHVWSVGKKDPVSPWATKSEKKRSLPSLNKILPCSSDNPTIGENSSFFFQRLNASCCPGVYPIVWSWVRCIISSFNGLCVYNNQKVLEREVAFGCMCFFAPSTTHIFNVSISSVIISFMTLLSFILPPHVAEMTPPTSETVSLLGNWYINKCSTLNLSPLLRNLLLILNLHRFGLTISCLHNNSCHHEISTAGQYCSLHSIYSFLLVLPPQWGDPWSRCNWRTMSCALLF